MRINDPLEGKRILITSYSYARFGGAELNAIELADQLVKFGMEPTFFSYDIDGPLKDYIERRFNTSVLTDQVRQLSESDNENDMGITMLNIDDYDYIWVGGNTLPISIIRQINTAKRLPKFIFIHMSQLIAFPLDAPLMPDLEMKIASSILSISGKTTTDNIQRILGKNIAIDEWHNPVPVEFKNLKKRSGQLRKVAVISSSYPSSEIMKIESMLKENGIEIEYIGRFNDNIKVVDAEFYDKYDLIVGIGKNARYSLVSGVPIYVYGRFGGSGYVDKDNLKDNEMNNFSGRGFGKKDAKTIVNEIVSEYDRALKFHEENRQQFIKELSIDNVAKDLFEKIDERRVAEVKFEDRYINWLISVQILLMHRLHFAAWHSAGNDRIKSLEAEVDQTKESKAAISARNDDLKKELLSLYNSRSWKITKPMRVCIGLYRKYKKKLLER